MITSFVCQAFQFQTGAIKRIANQTQERLPTSRFNSKLVRLKGTPRGASSSAPQHCFNSKLVRLKACLFHCGHANQRACFNSKLVRLKVRMTAICRGPTRFQFQTGAIKSKPVRGGARHAFCFNSKLVRLKVLADKFVEGTECHVSIPNWCD